MLSPIYTSIDDTNFEGMYIKTTDKHEVCSLYEGKEFCLGANYWVEGDTDGSQTINKVMTYLNELCWPFKLIRRYISIKLFQLLSRSY